MMGERIVVLGGGIIGLSCAFELQSQGHEVTVLELQRCGGQASGAAAGMLAPFSENVEGPDDFFRLCLQSLRLYPHWQETIKQVSKLPFAYENSGSLYVAFHEADLLLMQGRLLWQREFGASACILEGAELLRQEPLLSKDIIAALHIPEESHVYTPHYIKALEQACRIAGVIIHESLERVEVVNWRSEVLIRSAEGGMFSGEKLIICSGAWAQELAATFDIRIPVYPIRGQICSYESNGESIRHMIFGSQGYLVAKDNGTLVCGASEDIAGFDVSTTERGIERLRRWNRSILPCLNEKKPIHRWAGLRPATQDGLPLIGPLSSSGHVIFAVGHYRNGILLSPATAKIVADLVGGKIDTAYIEAFVPERFSLNADERSS
jgi:glycine oxidase